MDAATLISRLALVRYIYGQAVRESRRPEPICATAILGFHDAVEMFLHTTCEHLNAQLPKRVYFESYLDALAAQPLNLVVEHIISVKRLNTVRNNLKHHGVIPALLEVEGLRAATGNFLEDNSRKLLSMDFATVSLVHLVGDTDVRSLLQEATSQLDAGNLDRAPRSVSIAFRKLLEQFHARVWGVNDVDPFSFGESLDVTKVPNVPGHPQLTQFLYSVHNAVTRLQEGVRILALGIDYNEYSRFKYLLPIAIPAWSGKRDDYHFTVRSHAPPMSVETVRFGIDFVVGCAFKLQG
jgi:hypothetical protein